MNKSFNRGFLHTCISRLQVSYRESVGVKSDRIAPTIGDLARVRDLKGLKDLIHKPKATMLLDHAPHANEILKFGGLDYAEFKNFVYTVEDLFFCLKSTRGGKCPTYSKDEVTVDVQDEYYADIDRGKEKYFHPFHYIIADLLYALTALSSKNR
jgi:hypothetical protein